MCDHAHLEMSNPFSAIVKSQGLNPQCLKMVEKVSFNIASEAKFTLYSLLLNNHQGKNLYWSFKKIREMAMTR